MSLIEKILKIYPELQNYDFAFSEIQLQNNGDGDFIKKWNHPTLPKPTADQLKEL